MVRRALGQLVGAGVAVAALAGCDGVQNPLSPVGPQAGRISALWWLFFGVCVVVYGLTMFALFLASVRPRSWEEKRVGERPTIVPDRRGERRAGVVATSAVALTVVILLGFVAGDFVVGRGIRSLDRDADALKVKVTGRQWWWDVEYDDPEPSRRVRTANEIHIPVGRVVQLELLSQDVIHSFWAPNLHGKRDLVPGHPSTIAVRADKAGAYEGQCAEFCGAQHAHMRFRVVAEEPEAFERWRAGQLTPAADPEGASARRGREVFLSGTCVMCHAVAGTTAGSRVGPDLTHVASRSWIASGSLPNTRGNVAGWILDPQHVKPGTRMPSQTLSPDDHRALLDYLETLK